MTLAYTLKWSRQAGKEFRKLPRQIQSRIQVKIQTLAHEPRPPDCEQLRGSLYLRVRVGSYRIVYEARDQELLVLVILIGHRRDIYRRLENL